MRHCRLAYEMVFVWMMGTRSWSFDYSKGLEIVVNPKYRVCPTMMLLQPEIAILLMLTDEVLLVMRLKTFLSDFAHCYQPQIGCLASGNYNDRC